MAATPPPSSDRQFGASVAELYESTLVPLIFAWYARDLAQRVVDFGGGKILEVAAGTGVVTRELADRLPPGNPIVATDLNPAMLERAQAIGTSRPVTWKQADAMHLPFEEGAFDVVACQFGAMFFPEKVAAFAEARRVLRPGGLFAFNVWDRIEHNEFADVVTSSLAALFPDDPPDFLRRTPHGYNDVQQVRRDVLAAGFDAVQVDTLDTRSVATSPRTPALAYCHGTPLRNEIEARGAEALQPATAHAERALAMRFGTGMIDGKIQAHVVTARA